MAYSFFDIINIWWHGQKQSILYFAPFVAPEKELGAAPPWFTEVWPAWLWDYYLDQERRPTETWLYNYNYAARLLLKNWLDQLKNDAVNDAAQWVWSWTGGPAHGYPTLSAWLEAIRVRVGTWVPTWTYNLASGLNDLYWKLPSGIRNATSSWNAIWDDIKETVKAWVKERYDNALSYLSTVQQWLNTKGVTLAQWYDSVAGLINEFKSNPRTFIIQRLGATWQLLASFASGPLTFYYNLWGAYSQAIAELFSDPGSFILKRAEDELVKRW